MIRNPRAGARKSGGLRLEVFTDDELREIHLATLEVLRRTGVFVEDDEALDVFAAGGRRRRPRAPRRAPARARGRRRHRCAPPTHRALRPHARPTTWCSKTGRVGFTNFGEGIKVIDPYTGELRESTKPDVADCTRLIDALPEIDVVERPLGAHDVPPETRGRCTTPRRSSRTPPSTSPSARSRASARSR